MFYLITDQDNKSWRDIVWGENVSHTENNPNYHFSVFNSPQTATYMYPYYERTLHFPKVWEVKAENLARSEGFRSKFSKLTSLKEFKIALPTNEQRIVFGILSCMNLITNPIFKDWALKYLKGEDQTPESAFKVNEKLLEMMSCTWMGTPENQYFYCAHAILTAVAINEPFVLPATAAHRAYHDSLNFNFEAPTHELKPEEIKQISNMAPEELNLEQVAQIVNIMPAAEIASLL